MDQRRLQIIVVVASIVFTVLVLVGAYLFSMGNGGPIRKSTAAKPLTAERSRENARMITSSERSVDRTIADTTPAVPAREPSGSAGKGPQGDPQAVTQGANSDEPTEAERLIVAATAEGAPEDAIAMIEADLDTLAALGQAAEVYTVLGDLYLRCNPDDVEAALQRYAWAAEAATDVAARHRAALAEVEARIAHGDWDGALTRIDAVLAPDDPATPAALQLRLLRGARAVTEGDVKQAETIYGDVIRLSVEGGVIRPEAAKAYRQAGTRLIRLYRQQGRDKDAEAVEREMRRKEGLEAYLDAG